VAQVVFPDGQSLTMWLDMERTCEELARFSRADAAAYRRLLGEYDAVKDVFGAQRFTPVGFGPSLEAMLAGRPGAARWLRRAAMSAWQVVRHEFESRHVQAFMLWMAFQTGQPVDSAGSGPLAYSIVFGRQRRSWTIPQGGSGELVRALVEVIEEGAGEVLCGRRVTRLVLDAGRCAGVETEDGEVHLARAAVLSTIHVKDVVAMAPFDCWGEYFLYAIDTYDEGVPAFAAHYATTEPPRYPTHDGDELTAVSAGVAGWPDEIAAVHLGHLRRAAPNLVPETILAELVVSPIDLERSNPHMWHGTFHGGDRSLAFSGALRPAPGWAAHRMPIPGLYQTGGTTHPGGSVTGAPGRNAAIVMLTDLGDDPREVMAGARSARAGRH
jgi:phytoene dehydrogenase-like protein